MAREEVPEVLDVEDSLEHGLEEIPLLMMEARYRMRGANISQPAPAIASTKEAA